MSAVELGSWTVDELRAAGFDDIGVVQPLLRPADAPLPRAQALREALARRGELVLDGAGWTPLGDLGVVLVTRARARLVVRAGEVLLLGCFAPGGGLLEVVERDGACAFRLRPRDAVADGLLTALSGVPDRADGPLLTPDLPAWLDAAEQVDAGERRLLLEAMRADAPDAPPVQVRLTLVTGPGGAWLVRGGADGSVVLQAVSHGTARAAVRALLGGELSSAQR